MNQLNRDTVASADIGTSIHKEQTITPGIVHLGLGAFHRAHQALTTDECMTRSGQREWGIVAANLRSGKQLVQNLQSQNNLFTVMEMNPDGSHRCRLVSAITDTIFAAEDRQPLIKIMASEQIRIVSLTVTEKGYFLNPATGNLLLDDPLVQHDLEHPDNPRTPIGIIAAALVERRKKGLAPFTVLSCDNIPENGQLVRNAVLQIAARLNPQLADWISVNGAFPCTMVDRIVPAVTEESLKTVSDHLGLKDKCAVTCEQFMQWVIEDKFVGNQRPQWDCIPGINFVEDVRPYEEMKLRMLNGAHSFLAYTGYLGGCSTIYETMQTPGYADAAYSLMTDLAAPTLSMPKKYDLTGYATSLIERFGNPELAHKTSQIAIDGSQKIPQRWLNTIRWHIQKDRDYDLLALGIAAWIQYVSGRDEQGNSIEVKDPLERLLKETAKNHNNIKDKICEFLKIKDIFGEDLSINKKFRNAVQMAARDIETLGIRQTIINAGKTKVTT
ncbi:mannitol dehydrogenase family protein [Sansalvadorimonas sp. 2012CJ34-2]|uniref:Mannitol dehydrogenase family protein n=1 Tax=Parendozoicomonas callyspongiae TaxID=2942213 RepID=A0ABT0PGF8_9GAMM|nr:mannitol dehydrogenase family protein [Sansalvadorimonas sp. 2012CJ34-2]MCL6270428.1 mannitol dehydrogenase family protein [Sansalvadorimonas sp. 2012CJ34-2]